MTVVWEIFKDILERANEALAGEARIPAWGWVGCAAGSRLWEAVRRAG